MSIPKHLNWMFQVIKYLNLIAVVLLIPITFTDMFPIEIPQEDQHLLKQLKLIWGAWVIYTGLWFWAHKSILKLKKWSWYVSFPLFLSVLSLWTFPITFYAWYLLFRKSTRNIFNEVQQEDNQ
jgi:hypothetical protein